MEKLFQSCARSSYFLRLHTFCEVKNCSERHSVTAQSEGFFLETKSEKKFEKLKNFDIVNGKNYSFKRDNFKHDIPLTRKFNEEANYCGLLL